jgi:hypothetical protein
MSKRSTSSTDGPLTLHFNELTRVAGETITGRVDLNVALAQEDNLEQLRIKFRGTIHSYVLPQIRRFQNLIYYIRKITTTSGNTTTDHNQKIIVGLCPLIFFFPADASC